jgi:hypothetical protein
MVSPTGVAFAEGVSAQAVSRRVRRYAERHGLQVKRTETGRIRCFDLEQYKKLESKFRDPARDQRPRNRPDGADPADTNDASYEEAQRVRTWLEVEKRKVALREKQAELFEAADFVASVRIVGDICIEAVSGIAREIEEMCDAVAKGGEVGLRKFIREWVDNAQHGLADKLEAIVDEAAGEAMEPMYRNRH